MLLSLFISCHTWACTLVSITARRRDDAGQTTAEYALVLVGAAAVALLLIAWATSSDRIGRLFDAVIDNVSGRIG